MLRLFSWLMALGAMFFSLSLQASINLPVGNSQSVELYANSYALVIGVSDYEHWPDLPGVAKDIDAVGKSLKQHGFKVISLLNPTRASFDKAIRNFIGDYGQNPENRLLTYYAGHGHTLTTARGRELGYIVPADAPLPKDGIGAFKKKAISMLEIEIFAKQIESKHAMFTFDSCFSGSLFEITRAVPDTISLKTSEPVRQFITAGSAEQTVPDKSIFRNQFVAGLEGDADVNKDGFITGTELAQYIEESVTNYSHRAQTPQYGKIRDPFLDKGDFVFINPKMEITINVPGKKPEGSGFDPAAIELSYWETIKDSKNPESYQTYIDDYPQGRFRKLASLLIKQAKEQESDQVKLSRPRREELDRQQAVLEQQRRENEQKMLAFKTEQQQLIKQRKEEEAKLQALLKQQQAQAKASQQLAMADKDALAAKNASPHGKSMSVAVITWPGNLIDDAHFAKVMSNEQLARHMADTVADSFEKVLNNNNNYVKIIDRNKTHSILYEGDDYGDSKRVCAEYKVDKVIVTGFSRSTFNGSAEVHIYDCIGGHKKVELADLKVTRGETYYLEKNLDKLLSKFYKENIGILQAAN